MSETSGSASSDASSGSSAASSAGSSSADSPAAEQRGAQQYGQPPSSGYQPPSTDPPGQWSPVQGPGPQQYGQPDHGQASYAQDGFPPAQQPPYAGPPQYQGQQPPGQGPYAPQPYVAAAPMSDNDQRLWATLTHISIPFFGFVGPLVAYLVLKDKSTWLKDSTTEALNFSILFSIVLTISSILTVAVIGAVLLPLAWIAAIVFCIMAAIASNKGDLYRYPLNWRLVK